LFTRAVDDVRKAEHRENALPKGTRWAVLKSWETELTATQQEALLELESKGFLTATAYIIKVQLRWIRHAESEQALKWRITRFIRHAYEQIGSEELLNPVRNALEIFKKYINAIVLFACPKFPLFSVRPNLTSKLSCFSRKLRNF